MVEYRFALRPTSLKAEEKEFLKLLRRLSAPQRQTLHDFAAFLAGRSESGAAQETARPDPIPRPPEESVVKAIRRLMQTYPMLDRAELLDETAHCMAQHVMHGKDAAEVIDQLEQIFSGHYEKIKKQPRAQPQHGKLDPES